MSNISKLITLQEKIDEFSHTLYAAQMKKFEHVAEVYDSDKLSGLSLEEVKTILRNKVLDHINKKNINVHNVTPEQLNTLKDTVMQDELDKLLNKEDTLPLSYYGYRDYIPAPFLPNFHHIGNINDARDVVQLIEPDGTWVALANTTDGSNRGVSWFYLRDVANRPLSEAVRTGVSFRPSYIPADEYAVYIAGDSTSYLLFCAKNNSTTITRIFLVLTNGTLDPSNNTVVDVTGKISEPYGKGMSSFRYGDMLYLVTIHPSVLLGYEVTGVSISSMVNGNATVSKVTGWVNNRPGIGTQTYDHIKLADNVSELFTYSGKSVKTDFSNTTSATAVQSLPYIVESDTPGKFYLCTTGCCQFGAVDGIAPWYRTPVGYYARSEITISNKAVVHPSIFGSNRDNIDYTGTVITSSFKGILKYSQVTNVFSNTLAAHSQITSIFLSKSKVSVCAAIHSHRDNQISLRVNNWNTSHTLDQITGCTVNHYRSRSGNIVLNNPTTVSAPMGVITALSDTKFLVSSMWTGRKAVICDVDTSDMSHRYGSIALENGRIGIPPNDNRRYISEVDPLVGPIPYTISEVRKNRSNYTHCCMDMYTDSTLYSYLRFHSVSGTGVFAKQGSTVREHTFSYDRSKLINDLINKLVARGFSQSNISLTGRSVQLIVSKNTGLDKSLAILTVPFANGSKQNVAILVSKCTVTMSGDVVNSVLLANDNGLLYTHDVNFTGISQTTANVAYREMSNNDVIISFTSAFRHGYVGNSQVYNGLFKIAASGSLIKISDGLSYNSTSLLQTRSNVNIPSKGLYVSVSDRTIDSGFKSIGTLVCDLTTPTSFNFGTPLANARSGNNSVVLLSAEAANNWSVYFTQDAPVMINGRYGVVDKTSFTFNENTDQWGEWHVWVYRDGNSFKYKLTKESTVQPNDDHLYLGYIHTKGRAGGVYRAEIEKSIAINGYRVSKWSAGKSIPISEGAVNAPKYLNWV